MVTTIREAKEAKDKPAAVSQAMVEAFGRGPAQLLGLAANVQPN